MPATGFASYHNHGSVIYLDSGTPNNWATSLTEVPVQFAECRIAVTSVYGARKFQIITQVTSKIPKQACQTVPSAKSPDQSSHVHLQKKFLVLLRNIIKTKSAF